MKTLFMSIKFKPRFIKVLLIPVFAVFVQYCSDEGVSSNDNNLPFAFKVNVKDSFHRPLNGLKIGVYFHLEGLSKNFSHKNRENIRYGNTKITYSVGQTSIIELIAYDLENRSVANLIYQQKQDIGQHSVLFITGNLIPGVYKCVLIARDTLGVTTLYQDSIYAVLYHTDPLYNGIGYTNSNGYFEASNKVFFPSLYQLPILVQTNELGSQQVGEFTISDSISILVTDTLTNQTSEYTRKIGEFLNEYELIFPGSESNKLELIISREKFFSPETKKNKNENRKIFSVSSVGLEYFNDSTSSGDVYLFWKTNWESNNQGFEIQRKSGNREFELIGFVLGNGTTNESHDYSFTDGNLVIADYKYRLKIIAFDGSFEYSDTLNVSIIYPYTFLLEQNYPNPFN